MITLRPYQKKAVDGIAKKFARGINKVVFQLATGGGKTATACGLIARYLSAFPDNRVIFFVHREELLNQFRNALFEFNGISARKITAGAKKRHIRQDDKVFVAMVETANNRLKLDKRFFGGNIGLVIFDEAHLGVHNKLHKFFDEPQTITVGLTATPLSSQKKHPMNEFYRDIVTTIDIKDLIDRGSLCKNLTYHIKGEIDDSKFRITAGDYNNKQMGNEYSKSKNVINCLKAYKDKCNNEKTVIFNCNIEHSLKVLDAFKQVGYNARHLDGKTPKQERKDTLKWLKETPGAVLMNVGVLTAGFDEPSIRNIIVNRSTLSLTLWLQMTGRGSRPYPSKDHFKIIDLGGNALRHGDWCDYIDWKDIFFNPPKVRKEKGVAPVKECIKCEILIPANARFCKHCGTEQPKSKPKIDKRNIELELLRKEIDISKAVKETKEKGHKQYSTLHKIKKDIIKSCRKRKMTVGMKNHLHEIYQKKVQEWCKEVGKPYNRWHKETTYKWMNEAIKEKWMKKPKRKKEIESEIEADLGKIFNNPDIFEI